MVWADRRHRNPVEKPAGQELGHAHVLHPLSQAGGVATPKHASHCPKPVLQLQLQVFKSCKSEFASSLSS